MSAPPAAIRLDIVSDVVCPWCIIGFKQLEQALAGSEAKVEVHWQPFELNPQMPPEGQDLREHISQKYGSTPEQSQATRDRITQLGQSLGITFRYGDDNRIYNTFDAHRLLHWAGEQDRQTELKLALFDAFFSRRQNVAEAAVLIEAADRAGLDAGAAETILGEGRFGDEVRRDERHWQERGIHGVPAFVFDRRYLVSGAQGSEVLGDVLAQLQAKQVA